MPITMVQEAMQVPVMVRNLLMASIGNGMMKLQTTMVQNRGAKGPRMVAQKTVISERHRCRTRR